MTDGAGGFGKLTDWPKTERRSMNVATAYLAASYARSELDAVRECMLRANDLSERAAPRKAPCLTRLF